MSSRVLLRTSADVLRKSYLKGAVGTPQRTALDAGGPSMLYRGQFEPSLEINYVDDPRLAVGETFTRATVRTTRDFEGRILTLKSGEVGFWGFRRVENLVATKSEDLTNAAWTKAGSSASAVNRLKEDATNGEHRATQVLVNPAGVLAGQFEAARVLGSARDVQIDLGDGGANTLTLKVNLLTGAVISSAAAGTVGLVQAEVERSGTRWRLKIAGTGFTANATLAARMLNAAGAVSYQGDGQSEVELTKFQATGQNGQSFIGATEYTSVGVLASPFHGANVDGVRYLATDYNGALIKRYTGDTIKYLQLVKNTAGYASTPSSSAFDITDAFDIDAYIAPNTWNAAVLKWIAGKDAAGQRAFAFGVDQAGAAGKLYFELYDGTTGLAYPFASSVSSVVVPANNGEALYVRLRVRIATVGTCTAEFFTSRDGRAWTQLGTTLTCAATGNLMALKTAAFEVGRRGWADGPFQGQIFRVRLYRGFRESPSAVLAAEFNANDAAAAGSASFASSTTGETWTINGNAVTSRINTFTKNARRGLFRERASTNLQIRSDALDDATYTKTRATVSANAIAGLDGSVTGDKLVEDATAGATHFVQNTALVKAASALPYTYTAHVRAGERFRFSQQMLNGGNAVSAEVNLLLGTIAAPVLSGTFATGTSAIEQVSPGVYACSVQATTDAGVALNALLVMEDGAGLQGYNGDASSGLYVLAQQIEQLDHATSYIPTAAAAVPRNDDICHLDTSTAWFSAAAYTISFEGMTTPAASAIGTQVMVATNNAGAYGAANGSLLRRENAASAIVGGNATSANIAATFSATPFVLRGRFNVAANKQAAFATGGAAIVETTPTDYTGVNANRLQIGSLSSAGAQPFDGFIGRIHVVPSALADGRFGQVADF